ncbi:MAG: FadR family transcriptional regulator [Spirochaetia bacterium]|nr:FadR family transcriptional regulator [Spirochaetia bacterium]
MDYVKPVKQKTVVFQIMEQLKEMIATERLKPGEKMPNEYELAELFGVGRSTIREALKIFQYLGVVELRNPKGTFICESSHISSESLTWSMLLGKKDFTDLVELRMVLEHQGLWYLMSYHRENKQFMQETIENLRNAVEEMKSAITNKDLQRRINADYTFHKHIIEVCHNHIFNNLYGTMKSFMYEEISTSQTGLENTSTIVANHNTLINSILKGDYYQTTELFRLHIKDIDHLLTLHAEVQV